MGTRFVPRPLPPLGLTGQHFDPTLSRNLQGGVHDPRIELLAGVVAQGAERLCEWARLSIGPIVRHRVQRIHDGKNSGCEWNLLPREAVRIAGAVVTLVVATDYV